MAGRKSKYTPDVVQRITEAIRLGATYKLACQYAGISTPLFYQWLSTKIEFVNAVKEAEGKGAVQWLAVIEKAAKEGTWQAAAWKLERRYNEDYGNRTHHTFDITEEARKFAEKTGLDASVFIAEWEAQLQEA